MERGRSKGVKAVRSKLRWVASLIPRAMVTSRPGLLPRAMFGSVALLPCVVHGSYYLSPKAKRIGLLRVGPTPYWLHH